MSDFMGNGLALVEEEVERVKEAWAVVMGADRSIVSAIIADDQAELARMHGRMERLRVLQQALEHAAQLREAVSPNIGTAA